MKLKIFSQALIVALCAVAAAGCGATARLSVAEGTGPRPSLPPPRKSLIPTVVAIDKRGALLVADDVGNTVWRVTGAR